MTKFRELVEVMERLRAKDGCPWDRQQTHSSITPYLVEETYEVVEAIDSSDDTRLKEELGDLLLQILFHAQIAADEGRFNIEDVLATTVEKIRSRHPHVFGNVSVRDSREVLANWEGIKAEERSRTTGGSMLDGVPKSLPALLRAHRVQEKVARIGFDWHGADEVFDKVQEEIQELTEVYRSGDHEGVESELGDLFFSLVNLARHLGVSPEDALRKTVDRFTERFGFVERELERRGIGLTGATLDQMDALWEEYKKSLEATKE